MVAYKNNTAQFKLPPSFKIEGKQMSKCAAGNCSCDLALGKEGSVAVDNGGDR